MQQKGQHDLKLSTFTTILHFEECWVLSSISKMVNEYKEGDAKYQIVPTIVLSKGNEIGSTHTNSYVKYYVNNILH